MNAVSLAQYSSPEPAPAVLEFPCSVAQERFWLLDRLHPGNPALNIAVRWRLDGVVLPERVEGAFAAIIARHEILRTAFIDRNPGDVSDDLASSTGPMQWVASEVPFRLTAIDLTGLPDDQRPAEAERLGRIEAATPFDLSRAPLLRVTLVRVAEQSTLLLLTAHHLVCDGWSIGILAREFGQFYDGMGSSLAELPIQYGDYALWHRERSRRGEFAHEIDYWERQLAGLPYLEVPADLPHGPEAASGGDIVGLMLDPALTASLQQLGRQQGSSLFVTVLAALSVLLHRLTGMSDFAIGTQVAGRDEAELADMVGVFINTLVLRLDLSGNPGFPELLARTQDVVQGALDHQNLPMEPLIQRLQPRRDLTRNPFFSVNFIFQRSFIQNRSHVGFSLADLPSHSPGGLYDLNFFMVERPEGWRLSCEYDTGLFLRETVLHQLQALRCLLAAIAQPSHQQQVPIATLPLLDEAERQRLAGFGQGPVAAYPLQRPLYRLLEEQAARSPKSVAVVQGAGLPHERRLSYLQLDRAANRLARYLARQGVVPGTQVGLLLEHGIERVIALLAVLKAGGVVLGFDPATPAATLVRMLQQARLPLILTQSPRPELFAHAERVIALDAAATAIARELTDRLDIDVNSEQPACLLSSSDERRATPLTHRSLVNLLCALRERPGLNTTDTLLCVSPPGSGMALVEQLLPLLAGARLVLAGAADIADGAKLLALLRRSQASVMQARPELWLRLLEAGWNGQPSLKMLCGDSAGGGGNERLTRALADRLLGYGASGGGELWSLYGLPEAGIWSSVARVHAGRGRLTLGQPIANTQMHVLDPDGQLLPVGVIGTLHAGGLPQAAGHSTGDLARRRDDGRLERLGRVGQPMQRHGFRIELADIEDEILRHPGVIAARVTIAPDQTLTAAIVPTAASAAQANPTERAKLTETLRLRLARTLPRYMLPDRITLQPAAADRTELPAPTPAPANIIPPTLEIEARLLQLWSRLLGRSDITPTDDFFDLGGHSLLAARLLATISKEYARTISFATLFRGPTIRDLAELLQQDDAVSNEKQVVQVQPAGRLAPVFAVDHTWIYDNLARELGSDRPFFALQATHADGAQTGDVRTLQDMAAEQIRILRRQQPRGPYVLLGLCMAGVLAYEIAQQLQDQGEQVPLLIMIDTWSPGYLARQSRMQARLADWSYRWQSLRSDFRRGTSHGMGSTLGFAFTRLREFITNRMHGVLTRRVTMLDNGADVDPIQLLNAAAKISTQRPFRGRICLFHRDTMPKGRFLDAQLGWNDFAAGGIETCSLPGDHFSMFRDPGVTTMAAVIDRILKAEQI